MFEHFSEFVTPENLAATHLKLHLALVPKDTREPFVEHVQVTCLGVPGTPILRVVPTDKKDTPPQVSHAMSYGPYWTQAEFGTYHAAVTMVDYILELIEEGSLGEIKTAEQLWQLWSLWRQI